MFHFAQACCRWVYHRADKTISADEVWVMSTWIDCTLGKCGQKCLEWRGILKTNLLTLRFSAVCRKCFNQSRGKGNCIDLSSRKYSWNFQFECLTLNPKCEVIFYYLRRSKMYLVTWKRRTGLSETNTPGLHFEGCHLSWFFSLARRWENFPLRTAWTLADPFQFMLLSFRSSAIVAYCSLREWNFHRWPRNSLVF
jgi:hypothetical protein